MAYVVTVTFRIAPGQMETFLPLMRDNAAASVRDEPGCLQFDVCSDDAQPNVVFLYEVYSDRSAFDAHLRAPHFLVFDVKTAGMVIDKAVATFDAVDQHRV